MAPQTTTPRTNWVLIIVSIIIAFGLSQYQPFHNFLLGLGDWSYIGAFFAGVLFVFTSTVALAVIVFHMLGEFMPPWTIGIIAGFSAAVGDYLIFMFVRKHIFGDTERLAKQFPKSFWGRLAKNTYFQWALPVLGIAIVALPFPDEVGIALLGISKIKLHQFIILAFIAHAIVITLIATTGQVI